MEEKQEKCGGGGIAGGGREKTIDMRQWLWW